MFVERLCGIILGIDHEDIRGDFAAQHPAEGIEQQEFTEPSATLPTINGEPPHQCRGNYWIARQLFRQCRRQVDERDAHRRKRVITRDRSLGCYQDEAGGHAFAAVLTRLHAKIVIERLDLAGKARSVVLIAKRFDPVGGRSGLRHSDPDHFPVTPRRRA